MLCFCHRGLPLPSPLGEGGPAGPDEGRVHGRLP
nr:MAG TPA: hypothetical protein [Caudoviricetes sp.]